MVERSRPDDDRDRGGRSSGSTRGKWRYEPQKAEDIRARASRSAGRFDSIFKPGFDTWRPKAGDNLIRFLPGTWGLGVPYAYDVWVHRYVGADDSTYLCLDRMLGKHCPICDAAAEAKRAKDDEEAKQLRALQQGISWILDRKGELPKQPLLFQMSRTLDNNILSLTNIKEQLWIDNPVEGYDVTLKRSGTGLNTRYIAAIDRDASPIADKQRDADKIMDYIDANPVPDVLNFFDADYLDKVMSGTTGPRDEREEKEEAPRGRERERDDDRREDYRERDEPRRDRDRDRDGERDERAVRSSRREEPEPEREEPRRGRGREEPRDEPDERDRPARRAARDEAKDEEDEDRGGRDRREPDDAPSRRGGRRSDPEAEDQERDERRARSNGGRRDERDEEIPFDGGRRVRVDEDAESRPRRSVARERPDEPRDEEDRRPRRR
jgi:hypothetical protein